MHEATDHYARLLAPIYLWMIGGADAGLDQGATELASLHVPHAGGEKALDLGAGFGMHAIPLARLGYSVTAIDSSPLLLAQLQRLSDGLNVRTIESDLLDFPAHFEAPASLILCMGDTLTHLSSTEDLQRLLSNICAALAPGGRFIATFRDYSRSPRGDDRFIPVRSDADRIHTCFLEEQADRMIVYDIVHERQGQTWTTLVGHYSKLRIAPDMLVRMLEQLGLSVTRGTGTRGMVRVVAARG
jgi:SAM-dependent methyltransferase